MNPTERASAEAVDLRIVNDEPSLRVRPSKLVVAGYTGRNRAAVQAHIDELAAIGIPPPEQVPMLFDLDPALLTASPSVGVNGSNTSGEVEPVLIRQDNRWYLGVGSDHTDRDVEREDIAMSKAACPKAIGGSAIALPGDLVDGGWDNQWDAVTASCEVDGISHQNGSLSAIRSPSDLLPTVLDLVGYADLVLFCGTVPVLGGEFRIGTTWTITLSLADGKTLTHTYQLNRRSL